MKKEIEEIKKMWEDGRVENFYHLLELAYEAGKRNSDKNMLNQLQYMHDIFGEYLLSRGEIGKMEYDKLKSVLNSAI